MLHQRTPDYQTLHHYSHFSISRYCIVSVFMNHLHAYSHLRKKTTLSNLTFFLVHRISLPGHWISLVLTISCGCTRMMVCSAGSNQRQEKSSCKKSRSLLTTYREMMKLQKRQQSRTDFTYNCEVREKTNKMQQLDVYFQQFLNMFRASLCPSTTATSHIQQNQRSTPHAVTHVLVS